MFETPKQFFYVQEDISGLFWFALLNSCIVLSSTRAPYRHLKLKTEQERNKRQREIKLHLCLSRVGDCAAWPSRGWPPVSRRPLCPSVLQSEAVPRTPPDWAACTTNTAITNPYQVQHKSRSRWVSAHLRLVMLLRARLRTMGFGSWQSFLRVLMTSRDSSGFKVA